MVVAFFVAYEVVERAWLGGAPSDALWLLHILRGLSAAAIAGAVVAVLFLWRRKQAADPLPPGAGGLVGRLQRVSIRTKIIAPIVGLGVVPAAALGGFSIFQARSALERMAVERIAFDTSSRAAVLREFLRSCRDDVSFLSQLRSVGDLARTLPDDPAFPAMRVEVEREFMTFSRGKRGYYQLRYLDGGGREVVRLNLRDGVPAPVPRADLQDKSDRYYVRDGLAVEAGGVYVSPMDLNIEHGEIERPARGVVRYATPVSDEEGRTCGLVVLNLYAEHLFALLRPLARGARAAFVDSRGTYLGAVAESEEGLERFGIERGHTLGREYPGAVAARILDGREAGSVWNGDEELLSFVDLQDDPGDARPGWVLVMSHPGGSVVRPVRDLTLVLLSGLLLAAGVSALVGVAVGHYLARPIQQLRRATQAIVRGESSRAVRIETMDEIQGLADDFNAMNAMREEAERRLGTWNEQLRAEVGRRIEELHRLQDGLARADKLASLGQMSASVVHEVGNPLASIKTLIQVTEQQGPMDARTREVLIRIVGEVDRLAAFLRSVSRLVRPAPADLQPVRVQEVVQEVMTLMAPELRRRELGIVLEIDPAAPPVHGDAGQLRHVLVNLVLNGADASPRGQKITIAVSPRGDGHVMLAVRDRGSGIPEGLREEVWKPFFTTKPFGTGLGLAICRRIVEDHGGAIALHSVPGEGTTAEVVLPPAPPTRGRT